MTEQEQRVRRITAILLGSASLVLLVWDVYVANNDIHNDTISELVRDLSHRYYSLPFIVMIVMGHFFWNQPQEKRLPDAERLKMFWSRVAGPSAALIARDVLNLLAPLPTFPYANLALAVVGFFVGAFFWPQALPKDGPPLPPSAPPI
jgi:hypothetical protein